MEELMEPIIQIKNVTKTFIGKDNQVEALKGISLDINKGDIYGIIGMSGAGKSTLVRCLNYLEKPTTGTVVVEDQDLSTLTEAELRKVRTGIAMIFQHFNLLMQRSVLDNVCFPMEIVGVKKQAARKRAMELLEIVGLKEKADAYPSQLSGGQKQRVAIARALANTPKILLCDEATSALDPTTTKEILKLLQDINKQYGITIVIITHEMAVVQEICSHVAIIDAGELAEHGTVEEVFSRPQSAAARKLVFMVDPKAKEMSGKRCIRIVFTENSSFEPVIANMVLECKAPVNILLADTKDIGGIAHGQMILQLPEDEMAANKNNATIMMLVEGTFVTLYMTLVSTFMGYVLGLPMGIALVITAPKGLRPNKIIYKILDVIVNIVRSIPFLILLIMIIPLTRIIVGKSYGPTATIVPLTLAAAPFIARMVESSLLEVDHGVIEAAQSMGANLWTIIWKVMLAESRTSLLVNATIALGTILGYSAMAGAVGGGGLGDIAIRYGYYRYQTDIMLVTVVLLVLLVQLLQYIGMTISKKLDKRTR